MRSTGQQAAPLGNAELSRVFGTRDRHFAAQGGARPRKNRMGCVPRNSEASRRDSGPHRISLRARCRGGACAIGDAFVRRLPSQPAEYADGAVDSGNVCDRAATHSKLPQTKRKGKRRRDGKEEYADAATPNTLSFSPGKKCLDWMAAWRCAPTDTLENQTLQVQPAHISN